MLSSRWPRSPSHGKCSKRFCGSSRNYGRSHHQRQRDTFDVMHSRATDRRSASKCQGKWPDQSLNQAFGLSEVLAAVSTSRLSCKRAGKTRTLMPVWDSSGESRSKAKASTPKWHTRQSTLRVYVFSSGSPSRPTYDHSEEAVPFDTSIDRRSSLPSSDAPRQIDECRRDAELQTTLPRRCGFPATQRHKRVHA